MSSYVVAMLGRSLVTTFLKTRLQQNANTLKVYDKLGFRFYSLPVGGGRSVQCTVEGVPNKEQKQEYSTNSTTSRLGLTSPIFLQAYTFNNRTAIIDHLGAHSYLDILARANVLADKITDALHTPSTPTDPPEGERVCVICRNDVSYVVAMCAVWMCGHIAVPLSHSYPAAQLKYFLEDSGSRLVLAGEDCCEAVEGVASQAHVPILKLTHNDYTGPLDKLSTAWLKLGGGGGGEGGGGRGVEVGGRWVVRWNRLQQLRDSNQYVRRPALIVYTSGTTGRPKGVLHTHGSLHAQITGMVSAWSWTSNDVILHCLPLYHVHGVVNALMTPLHVGATCVMVDKFDARNIWNKLLSPITPPPPFHHTTSPSPPSHPSTTPSSLSHAPIAPSPPQARNVNVFTAVPTIYSKLIDFYDSQLVDSCVTRDYVRAVCSSKIRLFMSGSAPLPVPVLERWENITGHRLLERYGMTELGMALTNPYEGTRQPGAVGRPFPYVEVRIARPQQSSTPHGQAGGGVGVMRGAKGGGVGGFDVAVQADSRRTEGKEELDGELQVRGGTLFMCYWNKPRETAESFTSDGWFRTGDTAVYRQGAFHILGRTSVDIIKSGGYKISALDVERVLLEHPLVVEVAVVGVPDQTWGQAVGAILVLKSPTTIGGGGGEGGDEKSGGGSASKIVGEIKTFARERLPPYQVPTVVKIVTQIPRNAMGKVNKKQLLQDIFTATTIIPPQRSKPS